MCLVLAWLLGGFPAPAPAGPVLDLPAADSLEYALPGDFNEAGHTPLRLSGMAESYRRDMFASELQRSDSPQFTLPLLSNDASIAGPELPLYGAYLPRTGHAAGGSAPAYAAECVFAGSWGRYGQLNGAISQDRANNATLRDARIGEDKPLRGVPAPGAVVLGSVGVCIVGWIRRFSLV